MKIVALSALVVLSNVLGNSLLNLSVKGGGFATWTSTLRLIASPSLIPGILLLIIWMLLRVALLSMGPMTIVLPLTAGLGYVLTGGVGQFWFRERVPASYDYGLILIVAGVLLVGTSASVSESQAYALGEQTEEQGQNSAPAEYQL